MALDDFRWRVNGSGVLLVVTRRPTHQRLQRKSTVKGEQSVVRPVRSTWRSSGFIGPSGGYVGASGRYVGAKIGIESRLNQTAGRTIATDRCDL